MGNKTRDLAASVPWANMQAAILANAQRGTGLGLRGASGAVAAMPAEEAVPWLPAGWTEDTTLTIADAVSFALWIRDPLYRTATPTVRRAMESEEASALLNASEAAWKEHNGRVRGWVRKHLDEDLRQRSGGVDPAPDAWEAVRTARRAALLLDYVCVMRGLRVAIWWPEHKTVSIFPAAGGVPAGTPLVQLNALSGRVLVGSQGATMVATAWPALSVQAAEFSWAPPLTVGGTMTVAQIQEALQAIAPDAERSGGRVVLWNRLHWHRLMAALNGSVKE
jgi:hypothetical protein